MISSKTFDALSRCVNALVLVAVTAVTLFSCTLDAAAAGAVDRATVESRVARMIDSQLGALESLMPDNADLIGSSMDAGDIEAASREISEVLSAAKGYSGEAVVARTLAEENGEAVVDFAYAAGTADNTEDVLKAARGLLDEETYAELEKSVGEIETRARAFYEEGSRAMTSAQQKKFYEILKSMVIKGAVLLTAAVVYACIPKVMVWGKVSAACVASVCAGVLASGIMTFVQTKNYGDWESMPFEDWLQSVSKDVFAQWAVASTITSSVAASGASPVIAALVIAAYALYSVFDEAQDMYKLTNSGKS